MYIFVILIDLHSKLNVLEVNIVYVLFTISVANRIRPIRTNRHHVCSVQ